MCSATLNVGRISGALAVNIVPPHATIEVDRRLLSDETYETVVSQLRTSLRNQGEHIVIDAPIMQSSGFYVEPSSPPSRALFEALRSIDLEPIFETAHYATDASFLYDTGIPPIVFGPGDIALAHTRAEHISITDLEQATSVIEYLIA